MGRRGWLWIAIGVAIIAVIETISDSVLDGLLPFPRDTILVVVVVAAIATIGGWMAIRSIDRLTSVLRHRNEDLEASAATTRALHQVGMAIAGLADLDAILQVCVDTARTLLRADVAVLVRGGVDGTYSLAAASGPRRLIVESAPAASSDAWTFIAPEASASRLAAPLRRGEAIIGTLAVGSSVERSYRVEEIETLAAVASQAAIAIENARLQAQLREVAVRGERERIARELHDGLAQVLGYVNTKSQAVEELLAAGRSTEARAHLAELAAAARSVYVDVRETILGLSSPIPAGTGLAGAIEDYGRRFAEASKLAVRVEATAAARDAELPPAVEAQAFRVIQEALTNVRKHADAHRIDVALDVSEGAVRIEIEDDGRGLPGREADTGGARLPGVGGPIAAAANDAAGAWPRYGMTSMRERAKAIGGAIEWISEPGRGTTVRLTVPLEVSVAQVGAR